MSSQKHFDILALLNPFLKGLDVSPPDRTIQDDIIDFTFGDPAPAAFPLAQLQEAAIIALRDLGPLEYTSNQGRSETIIALAKHLQRERGLHVDDRNILLTNGAMDALSIACKAFVGDNEIIVLEDPTYFRASHIFRSLGAKLLPVPIETDGIDTTRLLNSVSRAHEIGIKPKALYTIPNHQNPTGRKLSLEKRNAILELSAKYGFVIFEDDVYTDLTYHEEPLPSLYSLGQPGQVIQVGSLSKVICPGLRLGWLLAHPDIVSLFASIKTDGGTNPISSAIAEQLLMNLDWAKHKADLREFYRQRRDEMLRALAEHCSSYLVWDKPQGGFFVWVKLVAEVDFDDFLRKAKSLSVSFLPGSFCMVGPGPEKTFRLSFSQLELSEITEGIQRIARAIELCLPK
jgi:2-aminoadipate transaminase